MSYVLEAFLAGIDAGAKARAARAQYLDTVAARDVVNEQANVIAEAEALASADPNRVLGSIAPDGTLVGGVASWHAQAAPSPAPVAPVEVSVIPPATPTERVSMRNLPVGNGRASGIPGPVGGAPDAGAPPAAAAVADPRRGPPPGWRPTPVQAAFLDTVAARESGGRYNIRYSPSGGTLFQGYNQHPRVAEPGPHGPSTAAGRYQFTYDTWKRVAGENTPFTPVNQDYYALKLAEQRYGPNLWNDLERGGLTRDVLQKLAPTWAAFRDPNAYNRLADVYASSYAYYTGASR